MNRIFVKILSFLVLCALIISCDNKEEFGGQHTSDIPFTVNTGYVKLSEDSAKIAGVLCVTANAPTVKLRWNVLPECNIDTTLTSFDLTNGSGVLPIKWNKRLANGKYNLPERMFDAGVELIVGEESKYVHLVWADGIDSTALEKVPVTTRATETLADETVLLDVSPETVSMDPVVGGAARVSFSGIDMIIVDQSKVPVETNIDKASIPLVMEQSGAIIFKWNTLGPPTKDFIATVTLYAGEVYKDLYIKYTINPEEPSYWEYLYSIPENNTHLPAKNASVRVYAKTNAKWGLNSLQSSFPVEENATSLGTKLLAIDIDDNPGPNAREVKVNVTSNDAQKEVLTFTQEAPDATFQIISVTPEDNTLISSDATTVTVKVRTDHDWWIQYGGKKYTFESGELGEKQGTITIPANTGEEVRNHSVIIGYGDKVGQIVNYYQEGKTSGSGTEFTFISANPANNASIPSEETTVTVKVNTDYAWWIDFNGVKTTYPAGALGEKTGTFTIPANTSTTDKNISYTVGYGETTVQTINYKQPYVGADKTLNYVSSNLPAGNIPATATIYTFTFEGGYTGQLRVRSVDATTGAVLFNGPIGTSHNPKVTVPANTSTNTRNIKFQYRLIDVTGSPWEDLPASTNRIQDGGTVSEEIKPSATLTPSGDIPEDGDEYTCTFTGGSGNVILRAMKTRVNSTTATEAARSASTAVPGDVSVIVPLLDGVNATIAFEYSTDGGNTWKAINDNRNQLNTWLIVDAPPRETIVPATNGSISFVLKGNAKQPVTVYVKYEDREIGRATGYAPSTLVVPVEDNPSSSPRQIAFSYRTVDGQGWLGAELTQAGK
jgi:lipoprotein